MPSLALLLSKNAVSKNTIQQKMDAVEEMKKWVGSLSIAEKRFVKLLGKARAGTNESQMLTYFDWLNQAESDEMLPNDAKFTNNLATVSNRLKDLILDALRLLGKEANVDALLRTTLDEIAILQQKDLKISLARQLRRAKKVALEHSRYGFVLQCLKIEQQIAASAPGNASEGALQAIRDEELEILQKQADLLELEYLHARMQASAARVLVPRGATDEENLKGFAAKSVVQRHAESGNYLEHALAVNILGIVHLLEGKPLESLARYEKLLVAWQSHPEWKVNQSSLLFFICHCFQSICLFSTLPMQEIQLYLSLMPDFEGLQADVARDFQRMLHHHHFILAFNTGQLDHLPTIIADIERWRAQNQEFLTEARILPFLHNILIAQFITADLVHAKRTAARIQQLPNRKVRADIREFAMLLQAVLHFELGDLENLEYHLRSCKRHFQKSPRKIEFELETIQYLERTLSAQNPRAQQKAAAHFIAALEGLASATVDAMPVLGLMEIRLWAKAKHDQRSLKAVFLEAVEQNLQGMK
jgi:hypothetical protein